MRSYKREYLLEFIAIDGTNVVLQQTADKTGLMIDFSIKKTITKTSNSATISITNPSRNTMAALQKQGTISLSAGYKDDIALILHGQKESTSFSDDDGTMRLELKVVEGTASYEDLLFSKNYGAGASSIDVVKDLVKHLINNVPSVLSVNQYSLTTFKKYSGTQVVYGDAFKLLGEMLFNIGFEYFLNKGELTILPSNGFIRDLQVDVNANNGMIGSPKPIAESSTTKASKNGVEFKTILNYNFDIGRRVSIKSNDFDNAIFKIEEVNFIGNSLEGEWISTVKAYEIGQI